MVRLLARVAAKPVLTISETEGFGKHGGILNLFRGESSLKFEANPSTAMRRQFDRLKKATEASSILS
jgi:hypothetical protein